MAFVGDDTWQQLAPDAFDWSFPYPSFNVKDLHSVDDGVWQVGGSWLTPAVVGGDGCSCSCRAASQELLQ